jgi:SAM-dependent methyltransferase
MRTIHPFPARMASDLAVGRLATLTKDSVVLDPMVGSGTVVRHASDLGFKAIGFDVDPLAILITRAWTTPVDDSVVASLTRSIVDDVEALRASAALLPWIDEDKETADFVKYWFGSRQRSDLRKLAYVLHNKGKARIRAPTRAALNILQVALSRLIITKDRGASLARDVSHSRPHKVKEESDFQVLPEFERSVNQLRRTLLEFPPTTQADVSLGDARNLCRISNASIDAVVTSPPYLNAIDYMRGHRLALVWLGYSLSELRPIRADAIGAERAPDYPCHPLFDDICSAMCRSGQLTDRHKGMVSRYACDLYRLMSEIARVLKPEGSATLVVGNSCLKGSFIRNSSGVAKAAEMVGLRVHKSVQRKLPDRHRYLPLTSGALNKRMRTETVLTFLPS